jgi:crotonobetainyl-CoA:carnitine CoA-transferase CaiB-like acyl-CoA transferase
MAGLTSADWTPCPKLGADNAAVLRDWLGYDDTRIGELERQGVLADRPPA